MKRFAFAGIPVFAVLSVACAHPVPVAPTSGTAQLTGGMTPAAPPPAAPVSAAAEPVQPPTEAPSAAAEQPKPEAAGPMTFEALSAALGDDSKLGLDIDHAGDAPAGKGLAAGGYSAVGAAHQVAADTVKHAGELQVSGGITTSQVRGVVRDNASRLRVCYERGLQNDPRLAGRVMVSFSVDAQGGVYDVEAQSESLPGDVTSCVANIFSTFTFPAPKAPPAKASVPVDFNKDS
jgi:hypothetical protein